MTGKDRLQRNPVRGSQNRAMYGPADWQGLACSTLCMSQLPPRAIDPRVPVILSAQTQRVPG